MGGSEVLVVTESQNDSNRGLNDGNSSTEIDTDRM